MKIVVGIGNPGLEYDGTRHNVGFDVLDLLAERSALGPSYQKRFSALVTSGFVAGVKTLLVKPQTYVNLSGRSVRAALEWYDEPVENLLVVCDDLNLPLGRLRIRTSGSSGGHKGLMSIAESLGTNAYPRLRIGIGQPKPGRAVDFVLSRFTSEERIEIDAAIGRAEEATRFWLHHDMQACMNRLNAEP